MGHQKLAEISRAGCFWPQNDHTPKEQSPGYFRNLPQPPPPPLFQHLDNTSDSTTNPPLPQPVFYRTPISTKEDSLLFRYLTLRRLSQKSNSLTKTAPRFLWFVDSMTVLTDDRGGRCHMARRGRHANGSPQGRGGGRGWVSDLPEASLANPRAS